MIQRDAFNCLDDNNKFSCARLNKSWFGIATLIKGDLRQGCMTCKNMCQSGVSEMTPTSCPLLPDTEVSWSVTSEGVFVALLDVLFRVVPSLLQGESISPSDLVITFHTKTFFL